MARGYAVLRIANAVIGLPSCAHHTAKKLAKAVAPLLVELLSDPGMWQCSLAKICLQVATGKQVKNGSTLAYAQAHRPRHAAASTSIVLRGTLSPPAHTHVPQLYVTTGRHKAAGLSCLVEAQPTYRFYCPLLSLLRLAARHQHRYIVAVQQYLVKMCDLRQAAQADEQSTAE